MHADKQTREKQFGQCKRRVCDHAEKYHGVQGAGLCEDDVHLNDITRTENTYFCHYDESATARRQSVGDLNDEQKELAQSIQNNSERLLNITGELLNMTQV